VTAPEGQTLYAARGSGYRPLLWGPLFALAGFAAELAIGGPVHPVLWIAAAVVLLLLTSLWVYSRRRFLTIRVTPTTLRQGGEALAVAEIADVDDVAAPARGRVLGGGLTVPRGYDELPLRLVDGTVVLAWAKDTDALREALHRARRSRG
jgi:hypothetical protein